MTPKENKVVSDIKSALAIMQRVSKQYQYYCTKDGDLSQTDVEEVMRRSVKELSGVLSQVERINRRDRYKAKETPTEKKKDRRKRKSGKDT